MKVYGKRLQSCIVLLYYLGLITHAFVLEDIIVSCVENR